MILFAFMAVFALVMGTTATTAIATATRPRRETPMIAVLVPAMLALVAVYVGILRWFYAVPACFPGNECPRCEHVAGPASLVASGIGEAGDAWTLEYVAPGVVAMTRNGRPFLDAGGPATAQAMTRMYGIAWER